MEHVKKAVIQWCEEMRVEDSEYFKMCAHGYHNNLLDATSLAYDLQYMLGIVADKKTYLERERILDSYQTGEEGFFYERNIDEMFRNSSIDRVIEMHGTYLTFQAVGAYKAIGAMPKKEISFYSQYMDDIEKYLEKNVPWQRSPWGSGGMLDDLGTILKCNIEMGHKKYVETMDRVFAWLDAHQDEETGMWGKRDNVQGINGLVNGAYHLMRGTYFLYDRPISMPEKIIDVIIEDLKYNSIFSDNDAHGCNDLDHFFLLQKCHELVPSYRREEIVDLSAHRKKIIFDVLKCQDGGFSFLAESAVKVHNYVDVSPGYKESDMQGTVFYLQTLISINKILGEENVIKTSLTHG